MSSHLSVKYHYQSIVCKWAFPSVTPIFFVDLYFLFTSVTWIPTSIAWTYIVLQLLHMKKLFPWNSSYRGFWPLHDSLSNFCLYNILANRVCRNPETFQINHLGRPIRLFVYIEDAHTYNMPYTWSCNLRQTEISVEKYQQILATEALSIATSDKLT